MYLMYVDESGDTGLENSPTRYFVLSAIVIHELRWKQILAELVSFRQTLRQQKGLKLRDEIHCTDFINKPGELIRIKSQLRPTEAEIDEMVNRLYGIEAKEKIELEELEEEVLVTDETEEDEE